MPLINLFEDDWRDCLKAHYRHVVEEHDTENERSLITVLHDSGFGDEEIQAMRFEILGESESDVISEEIVFQAEVVVEAEIAAEVEWLAPVEPTVDPMPMAETAERVEASAAPIVSPKPSLPTSPPAKPIPSKSKKPKQMPLF